MLYYADRISDNIRKREPEGYLICVNVPIARSGTQQYLQDEIGQRGEGYVTVYRPEEEVFSPATIASFEGMPVTNDHPDTDDGVTADNISFLQKGHCQNVRRGVGNEKDLLIADLLITDPQTIQDVLDGKREISCGYNYVMDEEDGKYTQRQIRGNHIAIVDKGRAGKRVCIKDSAPNNERRKPKMKKPHNRILAKMLAKFAVDADPEELEEAVDAIEDITTEEVATEPPVEDCKDEDPEDPFKTINDRLDALEAKFKPEEPVEDEDPEEAPEEDPLAKLEQDLDELEQPAEVEEEEEVVTPDEDPDEMESHFVDPDKINEQDEDEVVEEEEEEIPMADKRACDAARAALRVVKPVIAALPPAQRKKAADKAAEQIRKISGMDAKPKKNSYIALKSRKKAADKKADPSEVGRRIMESRNPQYKKK